MAVADEIKSEFLQSFSQDLLRKRLGTSKLSLSVIKIYIATFLIEKCNLQLITDKRG